MKKKVTELIVCLLSVICFLTACHTPQSEKLADGIYQADVTLTGGSGRATVDSPAALTVSMTDLPKVGMLGAGACEGRRDHGRREGGRVTVHTSAPLVGGVLDESLPADVRADARHDGRSCRCVPVRDVCGPCRRLVSCRPDAAGKDER